MGKFFNIGVTSTHDDSGLAAAKRSLGEVAGSTERTSSSQRTLQRATAGTNTALIALQRIASGDVVGGIRMSIEALSTKLGNVGIKIAAAAAAFSAGWQVGTWIRDITGLGNALDRLLVPAASVEGSMSGIANKNLAGLRAQLEGVRSSMEQSVKAADTMIARIDSIARARAAQIEQNTVNAVAAAAPPDKPVVQAIGTVDTARTQRDTAQAAADKQTSLQKDAAANRTALEQQLAATREEQRQLLGRMEEGKKLFGFDRASPQELQQATDLRTKEQELVDRLNAAKDTELTATDRARDALTALTNATTALMKAQNTLHETVKKSEADNAKGTDASRQADASAAAGAAHRQSAAREDLEKAQFQNETPERQLNYLRNKANRVNAEMRGEYGPVNETRVDELKKELENIRSRARQIAPKTGNDAADRAEYTLAKSRMSNKDQMALLDKEIADLRNSKLASVRIGGDTFTTKDERRAAIANRLQEQDQLRKSLAPKRETATMEEVLTAMADTPRRQFARTPFSPLGPIANMGGLLKSNIKEFADSRHAAVSAPTGQAPRDNVADNTAKTAASLERIEKLLNPPRR